MSRQKWDLFPTIWAIYVSSTFCGLREVSGQAIVSNASATLSPITDPSSNITAILAPANMTSTTSTTASSTTGLSANTTMSLLSAINVTSSASVAVSSTGLPSNVTANLSSDVNMTFTTSTEVPSNTASQYSPATATMNGTFPGSLAASLSPNATTSRSPAANSTSNMSLAVDLSSNITASWMVTASVSSFAPVNTSAFAEVSPSVLTSLSPPYSNITSTKTSIQPADNLSASYTSSSASQAPGLDTTTAMSVNTATSTAAAPTIIVGNQDLSTTTPFLLTTIIVAPNVNVRSRTFWLLIEARLAQICQMAFVRLEMKNLGTYVAARRRKRVATVGSVTVQMVNVSRIPDFPSRIVLVYAVAKDGVLINATVTAYVLSLLDDQEMALILQYVVKQSPRAFNYVAPEDPRYWIIGAVLGPVALVGLVWLVTCIVLRNRLRRKQALERAQAKKGDSLDGRDAAALDHVDMKATPVLGWTPLSAPVQSVQRHEVMPLQLPASWQEQPYAKPRATSKASYSKELAIATADSSSRKKHMDHTLLPAHATTHINQAFSQLSDERKLPLPPGEYLTLVRDDVPLSVRPAQQGLEAGQALYSEVRPGARPALEASATEVGSSVSHLERQKRSHAKLTSLPSLGSTSSRKNIISPSETESVSTSEDRSPVPRKSRAQMHKILDAVMYAMFEQTHSSKKRRGNKSSSSSTSSSSSSSSSSDSSETDSDHNSKKRHKKSKDTSREQESKIKKKKKKKKEKDSQTEGSPHRSKKEKKNDKETVTTDKNDSGGMEPKDEKNNDKKELPAPDEKGGAGKEKDKKQKDKDNGHNEGGSGKEKGKEKKDNDAEDDESKVTKEKNKKKDKDTVINGGGSGKDKDKKRDDKDIADDEGSTENKKDKKKKKVKDTAGLHDKASKHANDELEGADTQQQADDPQVLVRLEADILQTKPSGHKTLSDSPGQPGQPKKQHVPLKLQPLHAAGQASAVAVASPSPYQAGDLLARLLLPAEKPLFAASAGNGIEKRRAPVHTFKGTGPNRVIAGQNHEDAEPSDADGYTSVTMTTAMLGLR